MAVGANAVWLAGLVGQVDSSILYLLPVACFASLLPDIDATGGGAKVHYIGGGMLRVFAGVFHGKYFHHRGLMHSVLVTAVLFLVLWLMLHGTYPLLPYVATLAYVSHPLVDGFNAGVGYLCPFSRRSIALLPRAMLTRVGGAVDQILLYVALFGMLMFFLVYAHSFLPGATSSFMIGGSQ